MRPYFKAVFFPQSPVLDPVDPAQHEEGVNEHEEVPEQHLDAVEEDGLGTDVTEAEKENRKQI